MEFLLTFTARCYEYSSSWHWWPVLRVWSEAESPRFVGVPSVAKISLLNLDSDMWV